MAKFILLGLSGFVFYAIFYFSFINGLKDLGDASIAASLVPGTKFPLRTVYTGLPKLDELLTTLTVFFWPIADAQDAGLFIHSLAFSGTFGSAWILVTLESWRNGNIWTLAAFPTIFGLGAQVLTYACCGPLYLAIQLATSVTATKPTAQNIRVPRAVLVALPIVFTIGFQLPSTLMIIPRSEHISADLKQLFIAIWQPWPAYTGILTTVAATILPAILAEDNNTVASTRRYRSSLRRVYAFAFGGTAITHIIAVAIPVATLAAPAIFSKTFIADLHPLRVYETPLPWQPYTVTSVAQGTKTFLRWDYLIGSAGFLVWAVTLYSRAHRQVYGKVNYLDLAYKAGSLTVLTGPIAAAVELMWERDELIMETDGKKAALSDKKNA